MSKPRACFRITYGTYGAHDIFHASWSILTLTVQIGIYSYCFMLFCGPIIYRYYQVFVLTPELFYAGPWILSPLQRDQ